MSPHFSTDEQDMQLYGDWLFWARQHFLDTGKAPTDYNGFIDSKVASYRKALEAQLLRGQKATFLKQQRDEAMREERDRKAAVLQETLNISSNVAMRIVLCVENEN